MGWFWKLMGIEHTAELRGETVTFYSAARRDSYVLRSDAVQACKEAGIYKLPSDGDAVLVDGKRGYSRWE